MGKRILIAVLIVVLCVGIVGIGAAVIFSINYQTLEENQTLSAEEFGNTIPELPAITSAVTVAPAQEEATQSTVEQGTAAEEAPAATAAVDVETNARAQALAANMTLEEKICQMLFVRPEVLTGFSKVTQSGETTQESYHKYPVGGVIYFGDNLVTADQTKEMIENIQTFARERSGFGLFIGVDEEGGTVARLADNLGTTAYEDMAVYGAEGDPKKAYEIGTTLAKELKTYGFNVDFAPVADVLSNEDNTVVKDRSFGSDASLVASMVSEEVRGFEEGGVLSSPKHFPGHGSTGGDTHDGFAASDRTKEELENSDLLPFRAAIEAGAPMVMVGHMTMTALDDQNPASMSKTIITDLLRNEMGYNGIIITDGMDMGAISNLYTSGEAAVQAISAGCDMLLCVPNLESVVEAVKEAVENGTLTEDRITESVVRILSAKLQYGIAS